MIIQIRFTLVLVWFFIFLTATGNLAGGLQEEGFSLRGGTSAPCPLPEQYSLERPNPPGQVTRVAVGVYFLDLYQIDDVAQTFSGDVLVAMRWRDARLADPSRGEANAYCDLPFDRVWRPILEFMNVREIEGHHRDMTFVDAAGNVTHAERKFLSFAAPMNLRRFPFDQQTLTLELRSIIAGTDEVVLEIFEGFTGRGEEIELAGWTLGEAEGRIETGFAPIRQTDYSSYHWRLEGKREVGFFARKLIIPLALIVCMSWAIFWIHPTQIAPQMGIGATSMLTLIAYHFALAGFLPRISYLTIADQFIMWSMILVFLALTEAVATAALVSSGREQLALRIDRWCRGLFPLGFVGILVATLL